MVPSLRYRIPLDAAALEHLSFDHTLATRVDIDIAPSLLPRDDELVAGILLV
jgi:hypothetical protein